MTKDEIWKDIKEYEGVYQVSSIGRVKSLDRYTTYINGRTSFNKGKVLSGFVKPVGYCCVDLYRKKRSTKYYIHRLVAEAFIPNPYKLPQINHIDENPKNNNIENLKWCDCKYNINYGNHNEKVSHSNLNNKKRLKPVIQKDLEYNFIAEYSSAKEVERTLGIFSTCITRCCRKRHGVTQCGGYRWEYKGGENNTKENAISNN